MRLLTPFLCFCMTEAFDFIVSSKVGSFYEPITDAEGNQIGERFQNQIIGGERNRGISQGFAYNFAPNSTPDPANRNWIFFLDDGQVDCMDQVIIGATGSYEKYTGGRVSQNIVSVDPDYVAEITLIEPESNPTVDKTQHVYERFQITAEGGFYLPFTSQDEKQFGEMFQNPIYFENTTTGGWGALMGSININQGFAFNYNTSSDPFIAAQRTLLLNRMFFLPGGELTVLDEAIVQGTGVYYKYTGGSLNETVLSNDPTYIAEITLVEKEPHDSHLVNPAEVTLFLDANSTEAIDEPILNNTGGTIGTRFHVPVNNEDGTRLGSLLGYSYLFPNPAGQTVNGNRRLFLKDGGLSVFNDYIVHATGIYVGYAGGTAATSNDKITLIPPVTERHSAGNRVVEKSGSMSVLLAAALFSLMWL